MKEAKDIGRYAEKPADMPWPGWRSILKRIYQTMSDADLSLRCAGVAFFSFLSIFPVLACFVLIYGLVSSRASVEQQLSAVQPFIPVSVFDILQERLVALLAQPESGLGIGLIVSFAIALWSGSRGTNALIGAISSAYRERDARSFIAGALISVGMTLGGLFFLVIALFAIAAIPVLVGQLPFPWLFEKVALWIRWPILALLVWIAIAVLFRLAPHRESARWRWITPGAFVSTVLWIALSGLFSVYVENFGNYSATFGSLSVGVVMLLWIYYSTLIILLGASMNAELEHQTRIDTTTGPAAPMGERGAFVADHLPEQSRASGVRDAKITKGI